MSIRLNKAISELNIGLQTAVDFLEKKPSLGEVKNDLSFKLSDAQYEALVTAFKGDKEVHTQAEKLFKKPEKKDKDKVKPAKPEQATTPGDAILKQKQEIKPLGKIDLEQKPKNSEPEEKQPEAAAAAPAAEAKQTEAPVSTSEEPNAETPVVAEQPKAEEQPAPEKKETEIFTLKSDHKQVAAPTVLGTIDLSTINQSTRPKKKSKEEKRKEREEKSSEKKKRARIGKERVDVNDTANHQQGG